MTMMKNLNSEILSKRILFVMAGIFALCCLKLCAEEAVSPAQAQVERENFVAEAKKYVGCPYEYGAVGPDTFDCSGLIYFVAKEATGKQLPRTAKALYNYCRIVPDKSKENGDLLFFKTTGSDSISHVGIYIGNGQFISAISDGPNTGVIISSLNQDYWKGKYVACGQFLKSGKAKVEAVTEEKYVPEAEEKASAKNTEKKTAAKNATAKTSDSAKKTSTAKKSDLDEDATLSEKLQDGLVLDGELFCDWSLISPNSFMISWRGVDLQLNCSYKNWSLQPGLGLCFRYNHGTKMFQMPILFSSTLNEYLRIYAGPVVSFTEGTLIKTEKPVKASVFPGILGVSISSPAYYAGPVEIRLAQDISYTTFNNTDNSALNMLETISAGLVMYTGVKVVLPVNAFKNN